MKQISIEEIDFEKGEGIIPVVVQDVDTLEVVTLAYTNREALQLTIDTGFAYFFRRSHNKVMMKGVTSGNKQKIVDLFVDCDKDAIIYSVILSGPACHKGDNSCFHYQLAKE